jgi:tripartite-type tricarboxylate transporter receptor subunit TctC
MIGWGNGGGYSGPLRRCMSLLSRPVIFIIAAIAGASVMQQVAIAQTLPDPIRVIVPVAAGSSLDARARVVADALGKRLQRRVIVENRTGAGGAVGTLFVARAKPDGATLLFTNSAHAISAHLQRDPGYDPVRDFTPIASVYESGMVLVAHPDLRVSTVKELIALGKVKGDALNYGSSGPGSLPHLGMEVFKRATGMAFAHVPYKGDSQALADVLPGRIPLMISGYPASAPSVEAGTLKALAVTSPTRASVFPNVPTMAELGYPDATVNVWTGFFAPAKLPQALVDLLHREVNAAVATPAVQEHFAATGARSMILSPAAFGAFVAQENARYAKLVTELKLKEE